MSIVNDTNPTRDYTPTKNSNNITDENKKESFEVVELDRDTKKIKVISNVTSHKVLLVFEHLFDLELFYDLRNRK